MTYEGKEELERLLRGNIDIGCLDSGSNTKVSLETIISSIEWMEEDDRYPYIDMWITSQDTEWIGALYDTIYPLSGSTNHRKTFIYILLNISLHRSPMFIKLHKSGYKDEYKPSSFQASNVSGICNDLKRKGYLTLTKGYSLPGKDGVMSVMEPTEELLNLIPSDITYDPRPKEGLVIPKGFSVDTFPPDALKIRDLLWDYNLTVEPENRLYATHKGSFEVDGRFTGSAVQRMSKEDRKSLLIDGEPTVEIDISNCLPFLLYASELGEEFPGDAYDVEGIPRELTKKAFLMAVNCDSREQARRAIQSMVNLKFKGSPSASAILEKIETMHPSLNEYFYTGIGRKLMSLESHCMAKFMRVMLDKGIKFYPIYDSVRVAEKHKDDAREALRKAFTIDDIEPEIHED